MAGARHSPAKSSSRLDDARPQKQSTRNEYSRTHDPTQYTYQNDWSSSVRINGKRQSHNCWSRCWHYPAANALHIALERTSDLPTANSANSLRLYSAMLETTPEARCPWAGEDACPTRSATQPPDRCGPPAPQSSSTA